jgi:uncharacterized protein
MNDQQRNGPWLQTFSGRQFYPLDPREDDVHIEDIARALSLQNRYAGHTKFPYSVAQHCLIMSDLVPVEFAFEALMHDASEAYLCDIPRPIKPFLTNYIEIEDRLMEVISKKFNFTYPMSPEIRFADTRMVYTEKKWVVHDVLTWDEYSEKDYPPFEVEIYSKSYEIIEQQFLKRFKELTYGK